MEAQEEERRRMAEAVRQERMEERRWFHEQLMRMQAPHHEQGQLPNPTELQPAPSHAPTSASALEALQLRKELGEKEAQLSSYQHQMQQERQWVKEQLEQHQA
jgi:hypothetical protein